MLPYFVLLIAPLLPFLVFKNKQKRNIASINVFFAILLILLCFRSESTGSDVAAYGYIFHTSTYLDWSELEAGYLFLNKAIALFTDQYRVVLFVTSIICLVPLYVLYKREAKDAYLSILLFVSMSTFYLLFSGLRQSIAISIGVLAYFATEKKKPILFLLFVGLAILFHQSAAVLLLMYPLYHFNTTRKMAWFVFPVLAVVLLLNNSIYSLVLNMLPERYQRLYSSLVETDAYTTIILFSLFAVFSFVIPASKTKAKHEDKQELSLDWYQNSEEYKKIVGQRNFLLFALAIQLFAPIHSIATRFGLYYVIFIPLLIPRVIYCSEDNNKQIAQIARILLISFFFVWFFYIAYTGSATRTLSIFPYEFWW